MTVIKSRHVQLTTSELEFNYLLIITLLSFPLWQHEVFWYPLKMKATNPKNAKERNTSKYFKEENFSFGYIFQRKSLGSLSS